MSDVGICGLDEANAENKEIKKNKTKTLVLSSQNLFSSIWHWKYFIAGEELFFYVFHAGKGEQNPIVLSDTGGKAVRSPLT